MVCFFPLENTFLKAYRATAVSLTNANLFSGDLQEVSDPVPRGNRFDGQRNCERHLHPGGIGRAGIQQHCSRYLQATLFYLQFTGILVTVLFSGKKC